MDRSPPPIRVECNGKSRGLKLLTLDSINAPRIQVTDSRGTALELESVRQSCFGSIHVHRARCSDSDPVMLLDGVADATNNSAFSFVEITARDAKVYLRLQGEKNACRLNHFSLLMLHVPWEAMERDKYSDFYTHRQRSLFEFSNHRQPGFVSQLSTRPRFC
jgi:hypothetical protein